MRSLTLLFILLCFTSTFSLLSQVSEAGCAVGIEHIKELNDQAIKNVGKDNPELLKTERIRLVGVLLLLSVHIQLEFEGTYTPCASTSAPQ